MGLFSKILGGVLGFAVGGPAGAAAGLGIASSLSSKKEGQAAIDAAAGAAIGGEQALSAEAARQTGRVGEEFAPFIAPGVEASNQLLATLRGEGNFEGSPGFEFIRKEALDAINRDASAAGLLGSGTRLKALEDRAAGLASTDFGNFFNRLLAASGQGQGAAAQKTSFATGLSRDIGQSLSEQGQIRASSFLGKLKEGRGATTDILKSVGGLFGGSGGGNSLLDKLGVFG